MDFARFKSSHTYVDRNNIIETLSYKQVNKDADIYGSNT